MILKPLKTKYPTAPSLANRRHVRSSELKWRVDIATDLSQFSTRRPSHAHVKAFFFRSTVRPVSSDFVKKNIFPNHPADSMNKPPTTMCASSDRLRSERTALGVLCEMVRWRLVGRVWVTSVWSRPGGRRNVNWFWDCERGQYWFPSVRAKMTLLWGLFIELKSWWRDLENSSQIALFWLASVWFLTYKSAARNTCPRRVLIVICVLLLFTARCVRLWKQTKS